MNIRPNIGPAVRITVSILALVLTSALGTGNVLAKSGKEVKIDSSGLWYAISPTEWLEGRIAGVLYRSGSGNLGTKSRLSIRGSSSITGRNVPLYILDGIPLTPGNATFGGYGEELDPLAILSANDIESIEIMKNAAATALYGVRAGNGVIVITTRSGKAGKSDLRVNISSGFSQFPDKNRIEMAPSGLWLQVYNEGIDNYNRQYGYVAGDVGYKERRQSPSGNASDTRWLDLISRTGASVNADIAFSGGNSKTRFYAGGNYNYNEGIILRNRLDKMNFRLKVDHDFNDWISIGAISSANYMKNHRVPGPDSELSILKCALLQRPYDRPYKTDNTYFTAGPEGLGYSNPVQVLNEGNDYLENLRYLGSYFVDISWLDKISFKNSVHLDVNHSRSHSGYNEFHPFGKETGKIIDRNATVINVTIDNILSYNDSYLDKSLHLNVMGGHSFQLVQSAGLHLEESGFGEDLCSYALESWFGVVDLSYKNRYILNASLRGDGSSRLPRKHRWNIFPAISLGWNISEETWMENSGTELKLRAGYGKTGNLAGISSFAWQPQMSGGHPYDGVDGICTTSFGNNDLRCEKTHQADLGLDMGFFRDKLNIMLEGWWKKTEDLLCMLPFQSGIPVNCGAVRGLGAGLTIETNLDLGQVRWSSGLNISVDKNKIVSLPDASRTIRIEANRALQVGQELGAYYLFKHDGLYQYDGEVPANQYEEGCRAGDIRWKDVDGNGLTDDNDRVFMGSSNPDFFGGWDNSFNWKGITLGFFFTYMYGNEIYWADGPGMAIPGQETGILKHFAEKRWTGPGTTDVYPRSMSGSNNMRDSDLFLFDGSFLKLKALTLSYDFPEKVTEKLAMESFRIYAQVNNVFIASEFPGWDPEVSANLDTGFLGAARSGVPQPRTFNFGLNITF